MSLAATESAISIEGKTVVEELRERIAALVARRQQLRTFGASRASLEQNRVQLARSQRELSHALIERHLPALPA
jgi:septal ring factor EnvC (AmiA/AmiB activator)